MPVQYCFCFFFLFFFSFFLLFFFFISPCPLFDFPRHPLPFYPKKTGREPIGEISRYRSEVARLRALQLELKVMRLGSEQVRSFMEEIDASVAGATDPSGEQSEIQQAKALSKAADKLSRRLRGARTRYQSPIARLNQVNQRAGQADGSAVAVESALAADTRLDFKFDGLAVRIQEVALRATVLPAAEEIAMLEAFDAMVAEDEAAEEAAAAGEDDPAGVDPVEAARTVQSLRDDLGNATTVIDVLPGSEAWDLIANAMDVRGLAPTAIARMMGVCSGA